MRDALLAVSGELDRTVGGASVPSDNSTRRSVYLQQRRNTRPAFLALFDSPLATESCSRRHVTTVPLQVLAAEIAAARGHDVDQPRNLAKSVTVE